MEQLGALYHWSPFERRTDILKHGLVPGSDPSVCRDMRLGYVCLGPTPSKAWGYSGDMEWMEDFDEWDLWQVRLTADDDVRIRNDGTFEIIEIKVHNTIPPDRVWWVGERTPWLTP